MKITSDSETLAENKVLILYVLAQKLGYSCNEVDDEMRKKLKLGIAEEHEYEKEGKSLTKLQNHITGRY